MYLLIIQDVSTENVIALLRIFSTYRPFYLIRVEKKSNNNARLERMSLKDIMHEFFYDLRVVLSYDH